MKRCRAIPQALLLLLVSGTVVAQTQAPGVSPIGQGKPRVHQPIDDHPALRPIAPRVVSGSSPSQGDASLSPTIQNLAEQPLAPPVVLSPSQMPPSPPRITYVDGKLTIVANNSTLDDVLTAVGKAIDADIQRSSLDGSERVFGQFGPASSSQVLNTLLRGSRYDFVIVGSIDGPDLVRLIILTPSSSETTGTEAAQGRTPMQSLPQTLNPAYPAALVDQQRAASQSQEEQGFPPGPGHPGPGARRIFRPQRVPANSQNVPQQLPPAPE